MTSLIGSGLISACEAAPKPSPAPTPEVAKAAADPVPARAVTPASRTTPEVVRRVSEDGREAVSSTEVPADFPLKMPPVAEVKSAQRVEKEDGSTVFNVTYEAVSDELAAESKRWEAEFESMGLDVERKELSGGGTQMITLQGKDEGAELRASCILSVSPDPTHPGIMAVVTWSEPPSGS